METMNFKIKAGAISDFHLGYWKFFSYFLNISYLKENSLLNPAANVLLLNSPEKLSRFYCLNIKPPPKIPNVFQLFHCIYVFITFNTFPPNNYRCLN